MFGHFIKWLFGDPEARAKRAEIEGRIPPKPAEKVLPTSAPAEALGAERPPLKTLIPAPAPTNAKPRSQESSFNPQHISQLFEEVSEEMEWTWDRMLPTSTLAILVAFMKVGKSTLAYDLALSVSRGQPFLGFNTKQGGVLIISLEENRQLAINRLRSYGATGDDPIWVCSQQWTPFSKDKFYKGLYEFIVSNNIALVIIDSLSRFAMFKEENDNSEVTRALSPLLDIAHGTDTVILLLHHEPKSGGEVGRNIRGAGAIFANVDVAHTLSRIEGNSTARTLEILGRYQEYAPDKLRLDYEDGRYTCLGAEGDQASNARKVKVLEALDGSVLDVKDIADSTGL